MAASDDLLTLWATSGVPEVAQEAFTAAGFLTVNKFAQLEDTPEQVRAFGFEDLNFKNEGGLKSRAFCAALVDSWEEAKELAKVQRAEAAVARVTRQPVTLIRNEHTLMRVAYETQYGELDDDLVPATSYVERKFQDVTEGSYRAETLQEVVAMEDEVDNMDQDHIAYDPRGGLRLKRGSKQSSSLPATSEALRVRLKIMAVAMLYTRQRFPNRPWLQDLSPSVFSDHVDFLLGKQISGLESKGVNGVVVHHPQWELILSFEYQVRKHAYKLIATQKQASLGAALKDAQADTTVRNLYFLTPLQIGHKWESPQHSLQNGASSGLSQQRRGRSRSRDRNRRNRRQAQSSPNIPIFAAEQQGNRQRNGKGNKQPLQRLPPAQSGLPRLRNMPNGNSICFSYNLQHERCEGECNLEHACWWCLESHPGYTCPKSMEHARGSDGDRVPAILDGKSKGKGRKGGQRKGGKSMQRFQ